MRKIISRVLAVIAVIVILVAAMLGLNGCSKSETVNYNIRQDADNFKVTRRVIALNTRTDEPLFTVEGKISISTDVDGDLNVTIQTGEDEYKLFYAHLSEDVTYTAVQIEASDVNPYAYSIQYFPAKEVIENGIIDLESADE